MLRRQITEIDEKTCNGCGRPYVKLATDLMHDLALMWNWLLRDGRACMAAHVIAREILTVLPYLPSPYDAGTSKSCVELACNRSTFVS